MARTKAKDPKKGYATDFVHMMKDNMAEIKRQGVKVVVNAGGLNPESCRDEVLKYAKQQGIDLKIGCVMGDDLMDQQEPSTIGSRRDYSKGNLIAL